MPEEEKNHTVIGDLPDEMLIRKHWFLPTRSAVGTSILSHRWRHLFKFTTCIDFYHASAREKFRLPCFPSTSCLHQHQLSNIPRFRLSCGEVYWTKHLHQELIDTIITKSAAKLQEFLLDMRDFLHVCLDMEKLQPLFCCQALVVLDLHLPVLFVLHVPANVSPPSLKSLCLEGIGFVDATAAGTRLFSGCLSLEHLSLRDSSWTEATLADVLANDAIASQSFISCGRFTFAHRLPPGNVQIRAPKLSRFEFQGSPYV